jgi:3-methyladenine DNA glycosylase AlkD
LVDQLQRVLASNADPIVAAGAQAYMKDNFMFFGIKAPKRRTLIKPFIAQLKKEKEINWDFVLECFDQDEREFQYTALDYLRKSHRKLLPEDLNKLRSLILSKSWWDSVDGLATEVGVLVMKSPDLKEEMRLWSVDQNLWIKRVSIIHQLKFQAQTDTALLAYCIQKNLYSKEFFINKAIGWALRAYGEIDPEWVQAFAEAHPLAPLSRKEALRKIT